MRVWVASRRGELCKDAQRGVLRSVLASCVKGDAWAGCKQVCTHVSLSLSISLSLSLCAHMCTLYIRVYSVYVDVRSTSLLVMHIVCQSMLDYDMNTHTHTHTHTPRAD